MRESEKEASQVEAFRLQAQSLAAAELERIRKQRDEEEGWHSRLLARIAKDELLRRSMAEEDEFLGEACAEGACEECTDKVLCERCTGKSTRALKRARKKVRDRHRDDEDDLSNVIGGIRYADDMDESAGAGRAADRR